MNFATKAKCKVLEMGLNVDFLQMARVSYCPNVMIVSWLISLFIV